MGALRKRAEMIGRTEGAERSRLETAEEIGGGARRVDRGGIARIRGRWCRARRGAARGRESRARRDRLSDATNEVLQAAGPRVVPPRNSRDRRDTAERGSEGLVGEIRNARAGSLMNPRAAVGWRTAREGRTSLASGVMGVKWTRRDITGTKRPSEPTRKQREKGRCRRAPPLAIAARSGGCAWAGSKGSGASRPRTPPEDLYFSSTMLFLAVKSPATRR